MPQQHYTTSFKLQQKDPNRVDLEWKSEKRKKYDIHLLVLSLTYAPKIVHLRYSRYPTKFL